MFLICSADLKSVKQKIKHVMTLFLISLFLLHLKLILNFYHNLFSSTDSISLGVTEPPALSGWSCMCSPSFTVTLTRYHPPPSPLPPLLLSLSFVAPIAPQSLILAPLNLSLSFSLVP